MATLNPSPSSVTKRVQHDYSNVTEIIHWDQYRASNILCRSTILNGPGDEASVFGGIKMLVIPISKYSSEPKYWENNCSNKLYRNVL